mgnify:CR=1 FL=1
MFGFINRIWKKKKKYAMPQRRGRIIWTDSALKYNLPNKKVEIIMDGVIYTYPYMGDMQIKILEDTLKIPIIDMTGRKSVPKADIFKIFHPDIIEVNRF